MTENIHISITKYAFILKNSVGNTNTITINGSAN